MEASPGRTILGAPRARLRVIKAVMSSVNDVNEETLRMLVDARALAHTVLSLYLDLDPAQFATAPARATEIDSLLGGAHREIESGERPHGERQDLRAALACARELRRRAGMGAGRAGSRAVLVRVPPQLRSATDVVDLVEGCAQDRDGG